MKWPIRPLAEIADFQLGKMLDQRKNKGDLRPYLANVDVRWGAVDLADLREMRFEDKEIERFSLEPGDIVMCEGGEPGRCAVWNGSVPGMMYQKALHRIRVGPEIDNRFLFYAFLHMGNRGLFEPYFTGSTIKHMPRAQLARVEVPVPPLPTQRRIAAILSSYDDLIEVNTRRIAILEEMARRVYEEWFVRCTNTRWPSVSFDEIAMVLSGGTPKKSEPAFWGGKIPFFTPKDAPSSTYILETSDSITDEGLSRCASKLYPRDTTFITARGTVGRVHLASRPMAMNQSCYALAGQEGVPPLFLYQATLASVRELKARAHGAVFDTVTKETFSLLSVTMPPKNIMAHFEAKVRPIMDMVLNLQQQARNLRAQRELLLPRLISGKLSVDDAVRQVEEDAA